MSTERVHRTTIDVDLDAFESARATLGTRGFKETVNAALRAVARQAALGDAAELIRSGTFSAPTPAELQRARRERAPR